MEEESNPQSPPAALVESILLDDDSLLSPENEMPPESPLAQLDRVSPEQLQKAISESKSMENILLETSPTREERKIAEEDLPVEPLAEEAIEPEVATTVSATPENRSPEENAPTESQKTEEKETTASAPAGKEESGAKDESKNAGGLFAISESSDDFYDKLQSQEANRDQQRQQRTTSVSSSVSVEEAVPVAFEEEKGSGMKFVGSMQNVSRFFTEDAGGNDDEGKSFFDSFTAGETEGDSQLQPSTSPHPGAPAGDATVPVTPPIPSATSPLPSPMHSLGAGPRSRTTSHSSPVHSPILENEQMELMGDGSSPFQDGTDIFTHSLNMSDNDRRNDAWIPSEATRQAFINMVTTPSGQYTPDPNLLTTPRLIMDDPQGDPVHGLLLKFLGEAEASKRQSVTADDVAQDETGLRKLIDADAFRAAIDLTGRLLTLMGQGVERTDIPIKHSPYTLQLWFTRVALLIKMRQFSQAENELVSFGGFDNIDLFYEFYPENHPGRKGSMVPFAFRVLHAELPQFLGKSMDSLDRLYYIHAIVLKIIGNLESGLAEDGSELALTNESRKVSRALWEKREVQILNSIANCLLNIKDYSTAISICNTLMKKPHVNKASLLHGMGRIYVQMGDINSAQQLFTKAEAQMDPQQPSTKNIHLMNQGFVHLGLNQFTDALASFKEAVELDPGNAVAVNNMAVCSLYTGKLREAIDTLESLVQSDPQKYLHEGLLFNLCTLYELESSHAVQKKQGLLHLVSQYKSNGFNTACLKMA